MTDINNATIVGRLVADAILKYTNSGTAILNFTVANNVYQGRDKDDYVNFIDCQMWGKQAEGVNDYLIKGKQVVIQGELKQQRWETDNGKRSKIVVNVRSIQLVGAKSETAKQGYKTEQASQGDKFGDTSIPF